MYPPKQERENAVTGVSYSSNINPSVPQRGIATEVSDLQAVVAESCKLADQLKQALGISAPKEGEQIREPGNLQDVLAIMRISLKGANLNIEDAIKHLNS